MIMQKFAVGSEQKSATPFTKIELRSSKMVEAAGIEPVEAKNANCTSTQQGHIKAQHNNTLDSQQIPANSQESPLTIQDNHTSQQSKCVPDVYQQTLPEDLRHIVNVWPYLPEDLKRQISQLAENGSC